MKRSHTCPKCGGRDILSITSGGNSVTIPSTPVKSTSNVVYTVVTEDKTGREEVWTRLERHEFRGKTVVLKLKYDNFQQITRSRTLLSAVESEPQLARIAEELLAGVDFHGRKVRLIGLTVGNTPDADADCIQLRFDF